MSVEFNSEYIGDLHCKTKHGPSGVTLITDAPVDNGGKGDTFSPTDLVAVALGTCLVTVMGIVAKRSNIDIKGTRIHIAKDMAAAPVRRIAEIRVKVTFPKGLKIVPADRAKLEAAGRGCPVKQSLHPDVKVIEEFVYLE